MPNTTWLLFCILCHYKLKITKKKLLIWRHHRGAFFGTEKVKKILKNLLKKKRKKEKKVQKWIMEVNVSYRPSCRPHKYCTLIYIVENCPATNNNSMLRFVLFIRQPTTVFGSGLKEMKVSLKWHLNLSGPFVQATVSTLVCRALMTKTWPASARLPVSVCPVNLVVQLNLNSTGNTVDSFVKGKKKRKKKNTVLEQWYKAMHIIHLQKWEFFSMVAQFEGFLSLIRKLINSTANEKEKLTQ